MTPYITVEDYKEWADARGHQYGTDEEIEAAVMLATDFLDANYTFRGTPQKSGQQLPTNAVSVEDIKKAAAQAAYLQLIGRLTVDPSTLTTAAVTSESKQVGPLSKSTSYSDRTTYTTTYPTTSIDRLLKGLVVGGGLGSVVRC